MYSNEPLLDQSVRHVEEAYGDALDTLQVERAVLGLFFTGVKLTNGLAGLCATPLQEIPDAVCCPSSMRAMPNAGKLSERSLRDYLKDVKSDAPLRRTLGLAVLNALSAGLADQNERLQIELQKDAFDVPDLSSFDRVVVVGALVPMLKRLKKAQKDYTVLEMNPSALKDDELDHFRPAEDFREVIPEADLLVITGTTLLNGTLEALLACKKEGAQVILAGPTAGIDPEVFFNAGVSTVGSVRVMDADRCLDLLAEGASGYHLFDDTVCRTVLTRK